MLNATLFGCLIFSLFQLVVGIANNSQPFLVWRSNDSFPLNFQRVENPIFSDVFLSQQLGQDVSGMDPKAIVTRLGPTKLAYIYEQVKSSHSNGTFVPRLLSGAVVPQFNGTTFITGPESTSAQYNLCYDFYVGNSLRNGCWRTLKMEIWLQFWYTESYLYSFNGFFPCPGVLLGGNLECSQPGFAKYFLTAYGQPADCSGIKPGACTIPDVKKYNSIFEYYAAYNIFSMFLVFCSSIPNQSDYSNVK